MWFPDLEGLFKALLLVSTIGVVSLLALVAVGVVWLSNHLTIAVG